MGCTVEIIYCAIDGDRLARHDLGTHLGIRREHTMKPYMDSSCIATFFFG